jgi:hypothetical protein
VVVVVVVVVLFFAWPVALPAPAALVSVAFACPPPCAAVVVFGLPVVFGLAVFGLAVFALPAAFALAVAFGVEAGL